MKSKQEAKKKIKDLIKNINKWNRHYFVFQDSLVSDEVYDANLFELKQLETFFPDLKQKDSPTNRVGHLGLGNFPKVLHPSKMLSLDNVFNDEELVRFDKKIKKATKDNNDYLVEPKIDGLSINLVFENYKFSFAATRGDGVNGENITQNIFFISDFKKTLKQKFPFKKFELRGEIFLSFKQFLEINNKIKLQQIKEARAFFISLKEKISVKLKERNFILFEQKFNSNIEKAVFLETSWEDFEKKINFKIKKNHFEFFLKTKEKEMFSFLFDSLPKKKFQFLIRSEKNHFSARIKSLFSFSQIPFANPRNVASGTVRQLNKDILKGRKLSVLFFDLLVEKKEFKTQLETIKNIKNLGFPVFSENKICKNLNEVKDAISFFKNNRKSFDIPMDGVVIKLNQKIFYSLLGKNNKFPHYSTAYKFPAEKGNTRIKAINSAVGRTGKISYIADLDSIFLSGSLVRAATLHNAEYIEKLDIRVGDFVELIKSGDIIPKVKRVLLEKRKKTNKKWRKPDNCPSCDSILVQKVTQVDQFCLNKNCDEKKIRALIHFSGKTGMDIFGLSEQIIRILYQEKMVLKPIDFYLLKNKEKSWKEKARNQIFPNLGDKSIEKLLVSIELSKERPWYFLLFSINVPHLGRRTARILFDNFPNHNLLFKAQEQDFLKIKTIGEKTTKIILEHFRNEEFRKNFEDIISLKVASKPHLLRKVKKRANWENKVVVLTGTFSVSRSVLEDKLIQWGSIVRNNVSENTDILIFGKNPGSKLERAKKTNIKIVGEEYLDLDEQKNSKD